MAGNSNVKDIGWMYHSSNDPKKASQVMAPPTSQIPGLGTMADSVPSTQTGSGRGLIKETDTPYIVMAKQGGRRDLLCISENMPSNNDIKGYPRCDWYYLEDNLLEEKLKNDMSDNYESRLPDYMMHESNNYHTKSIAARSRLPYATEMDLPQDDLINTELRKPTNKKHPNIQRSGEKKSPQENSTPQHVNKNKKKVAHQDTQPMNMSKLLAMDYGKEWINERDNAEIRSQHRLSDRMIGLEKPSKDDRVHVEKINAAPWRPA